MAKKKQLNYDKLWAKYMKSMKKNPGTYSVEKIAFDFARMCVKETKKRKKKKLKKEKVEKKGEVKGDMKLEAEKAIFLDRDGVINKRAKEHCYVRYASDLKRRMFPNVEDNIKKLKKEGYKVIIISNQAGINKGIIDKMEYNKMIRYLTNLGIDMIYTCPHNYLKEKCDCRKPSPKMIIQASDEWNISRKDSWMVGDDNTDMESGKSAKCKTFKGTLQEFIDSGRWR